MRSPQLLNLLFLQSFPNNPLSWSLGRLAICLPTSPAWTHPECPLVSLTTAEMLDKAWNSRGHAHGSVHRKRTHGTTATKGPWG